MHRARTGRGITLQGALACCAFLVLSGGPGASARASDGVPAGVAKSEKTHHQVKVIDLAGKNGAQLQDFCVARDGSVVALVAGAPPIGDTGEAENAAQNDGRSQVCVLDADGAVARKWDVKFVGQAIGVGPDGSIYVGGNARLARFDAQGALLSEAEGPQMALLANKDELREQAEEQLEADKASTAEQIKMYEDTLKDEKQLAQLQEQIEKQLEEQLAAQATTSADGKPAERGRVRYDLKASYTQQLEYLRNRKDQTIDDVIASMTSRLQQINAITASGDDVYFACPMSKGYGYAVWRTDKSFASPKQIIKGLSGCCGQMDIQASGEEVYVAENSRHRVVRYDRNGAEVGKFGKTDREGVGEGFSGCCNPMNLCFTAEGELLAAESNGVVKRFTPEGKFQGTVGIATVPEGCKNSAIGISSDGDRVYYIDIRQSKILMLARGAESPAN